ncbi:MAG: EF-hand domain-containing protein [Methylotenera sp.]|nr:EF-hand domain-containing protein [Methylotenera sp.]
MKTSHILMTLALAFGAAQIAYADHHGADDKHHCRHGNHAQHGLMDADANKDGAISREEFTEAHKARAEKMFEKLDANKDGKIDESERKAGKDKMKDHCKMKDASK